MMTCTSEEFKLLFNKAAKFIAACVDNNSLETRNTINRNSFNTISARENEFIDNKFPGSKVRLHLVYALNESNCGDIAKQKYIFNVLVADSETTIISYDKESPVFTDKPYIEDVYLSENLFDDSSTENTFLAALTIFRGLIDMVTDTESRTYNDFNICIALAGSVCNINKADLKKCMEKIENIYKVSTGFSESPIKLKPVDEVYECINTILKGMSISTSISMIDTSYFEEVCKNESK